MENFNLKDTVLVLEDMDGSMNMCNAGKSTHRAFDLVLLCTNSYSSATTGKLQ